MVAASRLAEVIGALRRGTVPEAGLDLLAVGLERFEPTVTEELETIRTGRGQFKAVRGEYGCGKTFFGRWLQEHGRGLGFATSEVQASETETPCIGWKRSTGASVTGWRPARATAPFAA